VVLATFVITAQAADFAKTYQLEDQTLQLCASTPMKKMLFDLGDVALYAIDCVAVNADSLTAQPVHLTFKYERAFDAEDFIKSSDELIKRNSDDAEYQSIKADLERFNANYQAIADGERYDIGWSQATGLLLSKNNRQLAQHDSAELADVYFRIWFGDEPFSQKMKDALLSGNGR
ncbi:MAG TPA: chalcone isomerase family protein, partial [Methylotenera sp.]|nr:chalcone isomerase family protein [Methylotenera sp.]